MLLLLLKEDDELLRDLIYEMSRAENFIHYVYNSSCLAVFECVCVLVCLWVCLQTLLLDELADDVEDDAAPLAGLNSELAALADEKCCANVDTRELLPTTTDPAVPATPAAAAVFGLDKATPVVAPMAPAAAPFVVPDERDNEEVED